MLPIAPTDALAVIRRVSVEVTVARKAAHTDPKILQLR